MTPTDEAEFIAPWNEGLETAIVATRLGIPRGTVQSRAHRLQQRGLIQPRPKGGAYPRQKALARSKVNRPPSTVHPNAVDGPPSTIYPQPSPVDPHTWELIQLKHSIRWTIYVPQAMKEELQRRASTRGQNPSLLVQEALARWLAEEV
jgi:DNA-binding transcriptional MocR family regulator